ncbi:hypothetical protein N7540_006054 [Penicillium herquei]|nr:hypothetical protein N7540_006054 [Penicillium herquei]
MFVLTTYSAQERLHKRNMKLLQQEKPGLNADKIRISSMDRFQGHEAEIVLLDLVAVDKPGFVTDRGA